jgi:hypothetical protein
LAGEALKWVVCVAVDTTRTVAISDQDKQRLNKALAHITYERVKYRLQDNMYWPPQTTLLPLLIQCKEFVEHLLTQYPLEGDEQSRARLERLLPGIENAIKLMEKN